MDLCQELNTNIMKDLKISIFNLIEIFSGMGRKSNIQFNAALHCEHDQLHDFYCDSERPHLTKKS